MFSTTNNNLNFEHIQYRPRLSVPNSYPLINAAWMENRLNGHNNIQCIQLSTEGDFTTYLIDRVLKAKIPSKDFRDTKVNYWKKRHQTTRRWAQIAGSVGTSLAVGTGIALAKGAARVLLVALGVCSVAAFILMRIGTYKSFEAARQVEGWSQDPLENINKARANGFSEGFPYVLNRELKLEVGKESFSKTLIPEEVRFLFEKYFDEFSQTLLEKSPESEEAKKAWLDEFTTKNPVSREALLYAYSQIPEKFHALSNDFDTLNYQFKSQQMELEKLWREKEAESAQTIQGIERYRNFAMTLFDATLRHYKEEEKLNIEAISKYEACYKAAIRLIDKFCNDQISKTQESLKVIQCEMKKNTENKVISQDELISSAKHLLDQAKCVKDGPQFTYTPWRFTFTPPPQIPIPSPPTKTHFLESARYECPPTLDKDEYEAFLKLAIFDNHLDDFSQKLLVQNPKTENERERWLYEFTLNNPVSYRILSDAYGSVPDKYLSVTIDFETLSKSLDKLKNRQGSLQKKLLDTALEREIALAMAPFADAYDHFTKQAQEKLKQTDETTENETINLEYHETISKYDAYYRAAESLIESSLERQRLSLKSNSAFLIRELGARAISDQEYFLGKAKEILVRAKKAKEDPNPRKTLLEQFFQNPTASGPSFFEWSVDDLPEGADTNEYRAFVEFALTQCP